MEKRTTSSARSGNPPCRLLYVALAGALLLSGGWGTATTALAATPDARITSETATESMAPLLFLTPRVASILEDVFDDSLNDRLDPAPAAEVEQVQETDDESAIGASQQNDLPASPVADAKSSSTASEPYGPLTVLDSNAKLPEFQRQMYRTDI